MSRFIVTGGDLRLRLVTRLRVGFLLIFLPVVRLAFFDLRRTRDAGRLLRLRPLPVILVDRFSKCLVRVLK